MRITKPPKRRNSHLNMLLYGLTGSGKTRLLGTANDSQYTKPTLIIDIDGGLLTLADQDIDVVRPNNFDELQEVYDYLLNDNKKYRSVCVDTLSEFQRFISMGTILEEIDEDANYTNLERSTPPTRQDWLKSQVHVRKFMRAFRDLSYHRDPKLRLHVFMTASEKTDEQRAIICPSLPGVMALESGGYVDVLARLSIRPRNRGGETVESRFLQTRESTDEEGTTILAKNRLDRLKRGLWDPTIHKLVGRWLSADEPKEQSE